MVLPGQTVLPLDTCKGEDYDALFIPGGHGVEYVSTNYAKKKVKMTLREDVEDVMKDFQKHKKIIAVCSNSLILPVILVKIMARREEEAEMKLRKPVQKKEE